MSLDDRAEVPSLDVLQQQRRAHIAKDDKRGPRLRALHGPGGKWDALRKQRLDAEKCRIRGEHLKAGRSTGRGGVTDGQIDAEAHASPAYKQFLDDAISEAIELVVWENELLEYTERIKARDSAIHAYSAEARLGR
jgi:hypothetical protein